LEKRIVHPLRLRISKQALELCKESEQTSCFALGLSGAEKVSRQERANMIPLSCQRGMLAM
jgi:hypothetical protein